MSTDIEPYQPSHEIVGRDVVDGWIAVIGDVSKLASMVADTDFIPKALRSKPAAITAAILAGREVGIPPMRALQHLHMVEGRPTMSAEQKRAQALAAGHEIVYVETTTARCIVKGRRAGSDQWTTVTWSMDDAKAGKLDGKDNYRKWPRRMLQARATGELCDLLFPDATGGLATWEQAEDESDIGVASSNGQAEPKSRARRRTAVTAAPHANTPPTIDGETAEAEMPALPGEDGYDEPAPAPAAAAPPTGTGLNKAQRDKVMTLFTLIGVEDRGDRLALTAAIVNRDIASANDLTKDEASALLDTLEAAVAEPDPRVWLDEIIAATAEDRAESDWPPVPEPGGAP
jgi:hypothetical protein